MIFDLSILFVPFIILGIIAIGEAAIVLVIWLDNKINERKKK